ncbi:extracellular solute-binding protein [Chitinimonas sp. BJB300]|uniref:extracellular solute-binding protein n=1 Tax=Chitinimonas sp. BJB300 TaxID=1559339 RepID=UPI000C0E6D6E|nr:extracellular solute-binding protein [Chitinimonas sp. BJB300]PHV12254.1 sugar ABC transporter substrate-binding protein [Chitinimonas sp. BJB300]TSJ84766.1 extracellular solute-binding protein [Chitinimonas sp. BJB300]
MKFKQLMTAAVVAASFAASAPAFSAEKQKLEVWTMSLAPKFNDFFKGMLDKYNAQHPNVEVVWTDYPWDVIQTKFTAAVAAGKPPALVNLNVPWTYDYKQDGLIQPLDGLIDKAQYVAGALQDVQFEGKTWAFPFYNGANVIAYNTDIFKKAGLDPKTPPNSLDMQIAYAKQIKAKTGIAGFAPALGPTKVEGFFLQEGLDVIKDGKAVFNSPAHIALVKKLADAYKSGAFLKDSLFSQDNFQVSMAAYNSGRMAMLVSVPSSMTRVRDDAPAIYKVTEVAGAPVGKTGIASGGWMFNYGVAKNVDKALLPEIGKLGNYLTNAENQLAFAKLAGALPTARKAAQHPYFQILPANAGAVEKAIAQAAKNLDNTRTVFLSGVKDSEVLSNKLGAAVELAVTGRKTAKAALDEAANFWNVKLATK